VAESLIRAPPGVRLSDVAPLILFTHYAGAIFETRPRPSEPVTTDASAAAPTKRALIARALRPFQQFADAGSLSGVLLLVCAVIALAWANSPWSESYFALWNTKIVVGSQSTPLALSLQHWINDGLMAVFFLLVGLEIKRELLVGELSSPKQAALPIASAIGGMLVPALVYAIVNLGGSGARGWGIPMATDIAFALGVITLLGRRVPFGLKVFLAALAIVDDMGAVMVIALFYTADIDLMNAGLAALTIVTLIALNVRGVRALAPYVVVGIVLWLATLASGIHATIAGVAMALVIPSRTRINAAQFSERARELLDEFDRSETGDLLVITSKGQQEAIHALESSAESVQAPLLRLENALHGVVGYIIMPLFALANAGVVLSNVGDVLTGPVALGVALGLLIGKPLGITLFAWLAVKMRLASLPAEVSWSAVHGAAWLGGIGFTMSLFIGGLAFTDTALNDAAKIGILVGSALAGFIGWFLLSRQAPSSPTESPA
jgi:Na+:H+ antiporter, NhaA family